MRTLLLISALLLSACSSATANEPDNRRATVASAPLVITFGDQTVTFTSFSRDGTQLRASGDIDGVAFVNKRFDVIAVSNDCKYPLHLGLPDAPLNTQYTVGGTAADKALCDLAVAMRSGNTSRIDRALASLNAALQ